MGTFEIVKMPPGISLLPSRFTYKIKMNPDGTIAKFKARLVARGDMQTEDDLVRSMMMLRKMDVFTHSLPEGMQTEGDFVRPII